MISHCWWQIYIRLCSFHFFWHHLTTFTFTHLQDSYHDISWDCVIRAPDGANKCFISVKSEGRCGFPSITHHLKCRFRLYYRCALERKCHCVPRIFQEVEWAPARWGGGPSTIKICTGSVPETKQKQNRTETEEKVFEESLRKSPAFECAALLGGDGGAVHRLLR